jgi:hypothetical protein
MSTAVRELLEKFETLAPDDRQEVVAEILRLSLGTGDVGDEAYEQVARGVFDVYEKEESERGEN